MNYKYKIDKKSFSLKTILIGFVTFSVTSVFASLSLPTDSFATGNFEGKLKGVSITDAQGINQPPVAAFNYTQNGDTFSFDASGSYDSDGKIVNYKWDFGDGNVNQGTSVQFSPTNTNPISVTLTVTDDTDGVALTQELLISSNTKESPPPTVLHLTFDSGQQSGHVFDEVSGTWVGVGADNSSISFENEAGRIFIKHNGTSTSKITLPNSVVSNLGDKFTIEAVMRQDSSGSISAYHAVKHYSKGSAFNLRYFAANLGASWDAGNTETVLLRDTKIVNSGQWYTVRYVVDLSLSTTTLYIDGKEVATKRDTANILPLENPSAGLEILVGVITENPFFIDEIKIWNSLETP